MLKKEEKCNINNLPTPRSQKELKDAKGRRKKIVMKLGSEINEIHERTLEKINSKLIL
jgi:hypothetical protein